MIFCSQAGKNRHEHIMESLELFGREVLPEFKDRDEKASRDKAQRLEPVIEQVMARKPASRSPAAADRRTTSSRRSRGRSPTAPARTTSTPGSTSSPSSRPRGETARCQQPARLSGLGVEGRPYPGAVFERLVDLEAELEKLESQLSGALRRRVTRARPRKPGGASPQLRPVVDAYREYRRTEADLAEANEMLAAETDAEMREYLRGELDEKERRRAELEAELKELLDPEGPQRRQERHRRDPRRRGRRGGEPLGRRPLPHVPALRASSTAGSSSSSRASRPTWAASARSRSW